MFRRRIFISYRRADVKGTALALQDRLSRRIGVSRVFMDIDHLAPGKRFDRELDQALRRTGVLIAVIGPEWLSILKQRMQSPEPDYVRMEIAGALKSGVDVLPLLVDGAALPRAADLPDDLKDLPAHQRHTVAFETFGRDVDALVKALKAKFTFWKTVRRVIAVGGVVVISVGVMMNWTELRAYVFPPVEPPRPVEPPPPGGPSDRKPDWTFPDLQKILDPVLKKTSGNDGSGSLKDQSSGDPLQSDIIKKESR